MIIYCGRNVVRTMFAMFMFSVDDDVELEFLDFTSVFNKNRFNAQKY